jgi:hypothetical protein
MVAADFESFETANKPVIPAKAGIHCSAVRASAQWVPAAPGRRLWSIRLLSNANTSLPSMTLPAFRSSSAFWRSSRTQASFSASLLFGSATGRISASGQGWLHLLSRHA